MATNIFQLPTDRDPTAAEQLAHDATVLLGARAAEEEAKRQKDKKVEIFALPTDREPTAAEQLAHDASVLLARVASGEPAPSAEAEPVAPAASSVVEKKNAAPLVRSSVELSQVVRDEVEAANRSWFGRLMQGVNSFLQSSDNQVVAAAQSPVPAAPKQIKKQKKNNAARPLPQAGVVEELDLDVPPLPQPDPRYLEGQGTGDAKFAHFAFGGADNAFLAGSSGLWRGQIKTVSAAGDGAADDAGADAGGDEDRTRAGSAAAGNFSVALTQLGSGKITLNGLANQESPVKEKISSLALYGSDSLPVVVVGGDAAGGDDDEDKMRLPDQAATEVNVKIFAALDPLGASFATNKFVDKEIDDNGKFYDAKRTLNHAGAPANKTAVNANPINQGVVALAAAHDRDRFFVAVADGGKTSRSIYKRPDELEKTIRDAVTEAMGGIKQHNGAGIGGGSPEEKYIKLLTPDADVVLNAAPPLAATVKKITENREKFITGLTNSVVNAVYQSGIDFDQKNVHTKFSDLVFRDAINLRKGGLLDLGVEVGNTHDVGGGGIGDKTTDVVAEIAATSAAIAGQADPALAAAAFNSPNGGNETKRLLAAAVQVGLGWPLHKLVTLPEADKVAFVEADAPKNWTSLDSRRVAGDADVADLNVYVADQDSLARGVCVAQRSDLELITKNAAGKFIVHPGRIITTAMYDGIDFDKEKALAADEGKLSKVGVPCAVYSGADAYPASRAMIKGNLDMCWDDELQRLFVGFEDVALGDNRGYLTNGSGGVCSIMVGREQAADYPADERALYFQPIIGPHFNSLLFQSFLSPGAAALTPGVPGGGALPRANPTDYVVGFYQRHDPTKLHTASAGNDLHASAKKLRVMHTSTGKDYLVFNGGVAQQSSLPTLNSKMYALPLIAPYDQKLAEIPEAGLLAQAERPAAGAFYQRGLAAVHFGTTNDGAGHEVAKVVGLVDATDANTGHLSKLHAKVGTDYVTALLTNWGNGGPGKGQAESQAIFNAMKDDPVIVSGLASMALGSTYVNAGTGGVPDAAAAATKAFNFLHTGVALVDKVGYHFTDSKNIQKSWLIERIEEKGLDLAVPAAAADRAKTQAPSYDVARYVAANKLAAAADNANNNPADVWDNGIKWDNYPAVFGGGNDLKIEDANAQINGAGDAGGIAGGVAGIEGSLGWSIKNIFDPANNFHTAKLIPAVATMHADAAYPAFDYVRVGSNPKRLSYNTSELVRDVNVVGDTVYVALGGTDNKEHEKDAGVFASTAIFHHSGFIRSWTPWRRVQGYREPVAGAALDPSSGRYWTTTTKDAAAISSAADLDTLRVTSWGRGHVADAASDGRLSTVLEAAFDGLGGIYGLYAFGPETEGFKPYNPDSAVAAERHEQFSMTVATGNGRVALIKTGKFNATKGIFEPTKTFSATDKKNVFVFDAASPNKQGNALANLGIITCAEVSRLPLGSIVANAAAVGGTTQGRFGWLFVGGTNGVAVLTRWFNGKGWSTGPGEGLSDLLTGEQRDDFPGGSGWRWMQILTKQNGQEVNPFKDVRKLVSDGSKYLYIMTATAIWRLNMTALPNGLLHGTRTNKIYSILKRNDALTRADKDYVMVIDRDEELHKVTDVEQAQTAAAVNIFAATNDKQFLDMMLGYRDTAGNAKTQLIIGTTAGLFYNKAAKFIEDKNVAAFDIWTQVKAKHKNNGGVDKEPELAKPVLKMAFTSSQPGVKMKVALDPANKAQSYADGNLEVTALDADQKNLYTYRFNLSAADWENPAELAINPFMEPYHKDGDAKETTPYFYKLGALNEGDEERIEFMGPFDYFARTANVAGSQEGFAEGVWMLPEPTSFLRSKATGQHEEIDLGLDLTLPLYFGNLAQEPATGSAMTAGEYGLRVND